MKDYYFILALHMEASMNKVEVQVDKIRSYQTLTYKKGKGSFRTKEYKEYIRVISLQLGNLRAVERLKPLKVKLHFKCVNKTVGDLDNIEKPILDILQMCGKIPNDRQVVKKYSEKTFGHKNNSIEIEVDYEDINN